MQGRLSPLVDGRIQSFPWSNWREEFVLAEGININMMEWTLDQERLYENPLMTSDGQREIDRLCQLHSLSIPSLTGDCFMQAPFWKASGNDQAALQKDFIAVAEACHRFCIGSIVVPLVDNGRLENQDQENTLVRFLERHAGLFSSHGLTVVFESDFSPEELARFITRLDPALFGINYDIGNSAALGFSPDEEFAAYGHRVMNVHVKDRILGGGTVPLGEGAADFDAVFRQLARIGYEGNFILQTARADDEDHLSPLVEYREMTVAWASKSGLLLA
ncbi:sugar phosphate isomerase/epimerase [Chlorobium phaeovibrioides]|uniref:Sugar phosphate isomerase/epimerase n=1 Tax=Chlorobium phaeovibrioides TaxID=1094 RepID=A0A3S0N9C6_CHLPH|nr:sugar phosphate isomerase/epimerase [Chlorobium phaeovibrioides]